MMTRHCANINSYGQNLQTLVAYIGNVQQCILSRRGTLLNLEVRDDCSKLTADVPLESMFAYTSSLRNQTSGEGAFQWILNAIGLCQ